MAGYEDFVPAQRFQPSLVISLSGDAVAYSCDRSGQFNLWTQPVPEGLAVQRTRFDDRAVRELCWLPDGSGIVFTADQHGDEQYQVYLLSLRDGTLEQLTAGGQWWLAAQSPVSPDGRYLLLAGNDRDPAVQDLLLYDLSARVWRRFPGEAGVLLEPAGISPDGRWLLAAGLGSNICSHCYIADAARPGSHVRPVTTVLAGRYFYPGPWGADSHGFYVRATGRDSDHVGLASYCLDGSAVHLIDTPPWDVEDVVASADGRTMVWTVNENGRSVLRTARDERLVDAPELPSGAVKALSLSGDGQKAAVLLDSANRPAEILIVGLSRTNRVRYLTDSRPAQTGAVVAPAPVSYKAADGTAIPGLLFRPRRPGRLPVVLHIHGGPERQARPEYNALVQYLLASGIAVFEPNVRGSSGYGHRYQQRVYRDWGGIDLADFAAAAEYLGSLDWVDPARLAIYGSSYGGFAALSCLSRLPDLWAAGVSAYGPSNLEHLVQAVPPTWRALMDDMIGSPQRDADMLRARSPVTYAGQITAPVFILQGAQDPRVPRAESDQIVEKLRANGVEVRYDVYEDEGHGFTNRDNEIKALSDIAEFLMEHLLVTQGDAAGFISSTESSL